MKEPNKRDVKKLTPKDREALADHVRVCIMTAEASACTQVALDRLDDIQVAENGFWNDQRCVARGRPFLRRGRAGPLLR